MTLRSWWNREKYVAIHAQTWRFRVVKYIVLIAIAVGVYQSFGGYAVLWVFGVLLVLALAMHFFYRCMTKAWTESWGGYKKLDLPKE
jgi:hypothetical protein